MTDEARQRAMDFIVAQQSKFSVDVERLSDSHVKADKRMDRLERVLKLMLKAGMRARRQMREQDERFEQRFAALIEAQARTEASIAHTDKRLDALIDIIRKERNGRST